MTIPINLQFRDQGVFDFTYGFPCGQIYRGVEFGSDHVKEPCVCHVVERVDQFIGEQCRPLSQTMLFRRLGPNKPWKLLPAQLAFLYVQQGRHGGRGRFVGQGDMQGNGSSKSTATARDTKTNIPPPLTFLPSLFPCLFRRLLRGPDL